jgi:hypothetical protein
MTTLDPDLPPDSSADRSLSDLIVAKAKDDGQLFLGAMCMCSIVFGVFVFANLTYFYSCLFGPTELKATLPADPSRDDYFIVHGPFVETRATWTITKTYKGRYPSTDTTAFVGTEVAGQSVLILPGEGDAIAALSGRLKSISESLEGSGSGVPRYAWYLDSSSSYWTDKSWFVVLCGPLFILSLLLLGYAFWRRRDITRHPALKRLRAFGHPLEVVKQIGADFQSLDSEVSVQVGSCWIGKSWLVALADALYVYPVDEIVALGIEPRENKLSDGVTYVIHAWQAGRRLSDTIIFEKAQDVRATISEIARIHPGLMVRDWRRFTYHWNTNRKGCEARDPATRISA